ncbi:NACHT, LRR and PYD domains-containing protein 14 isoform X9 [Oryzias melastigma]|uniref:NACHT, LRR and PYD domains-containing protein 14 isoform X9 n=1 Tax=Oryzias melastigma TaxID=30732 RepID=UPI00168CF55C|nr:NACHT, LRR and PYD domains-containing protein 14 isoform X9 [Oryzias melastigma]
MEYTLFRELYAFLHNREVPSSDEERRKVKRMATNFTLRDNRLYYTGPSKEYMRMVVMSDEEKKSVLMECHINPTNGKHFGLRGTRNRVIAGYYWQTINHCVSEWLRCCPLCRLKIPEKTLPPPSQPTKIKEPWEAIAMYVIGPFSETLEGNQYVLTLIDLFTKFVVAEPLKSKIVAEVSPVLTSKLYTFGFVRKIITDQGNEFVRQLNDIIFNELNIEQVVSSECQPKANAQDERIKRALRKYINQNQGYWDINLAAVVYNLNTTKQPSFRHSPYFLFFQRHPRRPVMINACPLDDNFEVAVPGEDTDTRDKEMTFLNEQALNDTEEAQDTQGTSFGTQKQNQAAAVKMPESRKRKRSSSCSSPRMLIESPGRSEFPASTSISMMSDTSKYNPPNFSLEEKQRSEFTASTSMSMMSDTSKYNPPNFRLEFPAVSSVSMRSDTSKYNPPNFSQEAKQRSEFTGGSSVSMRSDTSKYNPPNFSQEAKQRPEFTGGSSVSMRSDTSKYNPPNFSQEEKQSQNLSCSACGQIPNTLVLFKCGHLSCQQCIDSLLGSGCPICEAKPKKVTGDQSLQEPKKKLRKAMQQKFDLTSEGIRDQKSPLKSIYTTLYITTRAPEELSGEHEYSSLKFVLKMKPSGDFSVQLDTLFKQFAHKDKPQRMILTNGIAGIGKSFAVQKFILDWAEEKFEQDVDFVFFLAFRELHMCKGEKSLLQVLIDFHPSLQLNDLKSLEQTRTIVILDGFDESRLQLDFDNSKTITSISERTTVDNLLVNLIKGNILPNANIWITSRPAAANQIPAKYVNMVTEIRGFNDAQKVEYFRKRLSPDLSLAERVISHIQSSQTLDMMCQIPIFCWISVILFQDVFRGDEEAETPKTLTEMMAHFLFVQTKRRCRKYEKSETSKEKLLKTHRDFLLKLGKLAFVQLQENKLIFYEDDLKECGIDVEEASVYSGFCNTVLRNEEVFFQRKIFFFVHLTIQEFFAAIYVYECLATNTTGDLSSFLDLKLKHSLLDLLKKTVDKVLEKKNGHLDFFLRFLLGLMVESNKRVLKGLLTPLDPKQETDKKILTYLRSIRRKTLSPDSCISIFQTMVEMRDHKVKDEIEEYLKLSDHSETELTPLHCSALAFMLMISKNELEELNLKSYKTSEEGRRRLIPAVRSSKKAVLRECKVTEEWVEHLAFGLKSPFSPLRVLDLSTNDLRDSGVKKLCVGLSNSCCRLQKLRLSGCMVTEEGCSHLVSALQSNPSHLTDLDLSYNHPGDSGRKMLSELKDDPRYALNTLNLNYGGEHRMKPGLKKYAFKFTLDSNTAHRNLLLSDMNTKVTWVENKQPYSPHPERFDQQFQVMSEQGVQHSCFFEVEKEEPFSVGLTYKSIERKGDSTDSRLGSNEKSWIMSCTKSGCYVRHGNEVFHVTSLCPRSSHVGVFLDWEAGELSFYRVSNDNLTFLHTFQECFSDALYAAVEMNPQSYAHFCHVTRS